MKIFFNLALIFFTSEIAAQDRVTVTPQEQAFYDKAMPVIKKEYKNLVLHTAAQLRGKTINADSLTIALSRNDMLNGLNGTDIEALAFLVLMEAAKSAREDMKSIMSEIKETNKQKETIRNQKQVYPVKKDSSRRIINTKIIPNVKQRDSMDQASQMSDIRLQMAMDRRSKVMTALSNIMKKISDTQNQIISNLK